MATRIWSGVTGSWYTATDWTAGIAPVPGDTADISSGIVGFAANAGDVDGVFDGVTVNLGSTSSSNPAQLTSTGARFGHNFTIDSGGSSGLYAEFLSVGTTGFAGTIDLASLDGGFEIATEASSTQAGGAFVLETAGSIDFGITNTFLAVSGKLIDEGEISVYAGDTLDNTGTIVVTASQGGDLYLGTSSVLEGGGTIEVDDNGVALVENEVSATQQTFVFNGKGGVFAFASPNFVLGTIENFASGDFIDLLDIPETNASYNASTSTLSAYAVSNGQTSDLVTLHVTSSTLSSGPLTVVTDGDGGTQIEAVGSPTPHQEFILGGVDAMNAEVVQAETLPSGSLDLGTGVKIGVISDSFNSLGGANMDAANGYLPASGGVSAVDVLVDDPSTGSDEGRAMAELVHAVAPGAQIYFASDATNAGLAGAINDMIAAGVNIIVDDVEDPAEPDFQVAGAIDNSVQTAINDGISYFTSATNYGSSSYQATFTATQTTLPGVTGTVYAQTFSNNTTFQAINLSESGTEVALQWATAFPVLGGSSPDAMEVVLYDSNENVVSSTVAATSTQTTGQDGFASEPEVELSVPGSGTYYLAIYQTAAQETATPVSQFKYILYGPGGSATEIEDPAAANNSGVVSGHGLVPGVNTVAATSFENSPDFTGVGETEWFSATGPGELLYTSTGAVEASPVADGKPDFTAPDGISVSSDLSEFQPFYGTSAAAPNAAAVAALMLQANPKLTPAQITADLESSAYNLGLPTDAEGAGLVQANGAVQLALAAACYATGTRLRTTGGERPVENLREGDVMLTAHGALRPVIWIGRRHVDCRRHPNPAAVQPVRVRSGAFGPGLPCRDLRLSPDHAVFIEAEGVLIPAGLLVNGTTIVRERVEAVTYLHVELAEHDLLLAEGLPAESYLDAGNRAAFANCGPGEPVAFRPDFVRHGSGAGGCAPCVTGGSVLERVREALAHGAAAARRAAVA